MLYLKKNGCFLMTSLWSQRIILGIQYQIMSSVLGFLIEILLILTYDLGSTHQAMNDSLFHMM
jgi:hypothetical protein